MPIVIPTWYRIANQWHLLSLTQLDAAHCGLALVGPQDTRSHLHGNDIYKVPPAQTVCTTCLNYYQST